MTTKLTLTIEKSLTEKIKVYAKGTQRSVSEMVSKYFESVVEDKSDDEYTARIEKLAGSLKLPTDFDDKKALDDYYKEKYGI